MTADVNIPRTWPIVLQTHFWARSGPARHISNIPGEHVTVPPLGITITWMNLDLQRYWGVQVRDPRFVTGTGDD